MSLSGLEEGYENGFLNCESGRILFIANSGIYDPATLAFRQRKDQIQIEFDDVRHFFDEVGNPQ
jgi:hypothetical protein